MSESVTSLAGSGIFFCDMSFSNIAALKEWYVKLGFIVPFGDNIRPQSQCVLEHFQQSIDMDRYEIDHRDLGGLIRYYVGVGNRIHARGLAASKPLQLDYYFEKYNDNETSQAKEAKENK